MKYVVTKLEDGRVDLTVHFGPDNTDKSMGVTVSDPSAVWVGIDVLSDNLMKELCGFTSFDLRMALHEAFR